MFNLFGRVREWAKQAFLAGIADGLDVLEKAGAGDAGDAEQRLRDRFTLPAPGTAENAPQQVIDVKPKRVGKS